VIPTHPFFLQIPFQEPGTHEEGAGLFTFLLKIWEFAMTHGRTALTLLTAALVAGPMFAGERALAKDLLESSRTRVMGLRQSLGLDERHDFSVQRGHVDELWQTHTRLNQFFQGVRVWGGEVITHENADGSFRPMTTELRRNITISVKPTLSDVEVLGLVHADLNPKGAYAYAPTTELVIFPEMMEVARRSGRPDREMGAEDVARQVLRYKLAYHVHTELENGTEETAHTDYMVDAHSGVILKKWSTLHTTDAVGSGKSQFSGTVAIHTNLNGSSYELKDTYRAMNISTYDLAHGTSSTSTGTLYTDSDNVWGDGTNYTGSTTSTTSATGQTAAVDAHYGVEMTYDFYKNVLGRNGIDGNNKATYSRVHYSTSYDNAFWSDTCFCMTYGDGSSFKSLESLDVAGHEMSHGVCANSANLAYSGESGGLNEANSDMFGNMVELYAANSFALPATVDNTNACWTVGEKLETTSYPTPLRYMYKPSLDGSSKDAWSSTLGNLDVHYSSGPANRMFFFLSQGASSSSTSNYYSSYAASGFTGIGPEKAIKIWYRALTTYMTSSTNYASARTACLSAASDLYGTTGAEYAAVQNAFGAINVGSLAPTGVTVAISPTTATVAAGATYQFTASVSGSTTTTVTWTATGGTVSTTGLFTAPTTAGTYTVKATSTADTTKSASATVTVTAAGTVSITMTPTTATVATGGTQQFTASVTGSTNTAVTYTATGGTISSTGLYTAPTTAGTYTVTAKASADTTKTATSTVTVTSTSTTYAEVESNGTTSTANVLGSTITKVTGYIGSSSDVDYFKVLVPASTTIYVSMTGPSDKDYDLYLYNSSGSQKAYSYGSTSTESLSYKNTSTSAAYFYIKVNGYSSAYSTTTGYTLTITR